jgi:endoglucanase
MRDMLGLYKQAGWGWALWNFAGSFGICDSGRADVKYETWHGRKLNRAMLEVLQAF